MHHIRLEALDQTAQPEDRARIWKPSSHAQPVDADPFTLDFFNVGIWFRQANDCDLPPACLQLSSQAGHLSFGTPEREGSYKD
jgi:hypothetical protein